MAFRLGWYAVIAPAVIGALIYANWYAITADVDRSPIQPPLVAPPKVQIELPSASEVSGRTVADLPQTVQRPLFFSDRRLPEKPKPKPKLPVVEVKEPVVNLEPLVLVGIKRHGDQSQVLVRSAAETIGTWLSVGEQFRGWQLREVRSDNAIMEGRGRRLELRLYSPQQISKQ